MLKKIFKIIIYSLIVTFVLNQNVCNEIDEYLKGRNIQPLPNCFGGLNGEILNLDITNNDSFNEEDYKKIFSYDTLGTLNTLIYKYITTNVPSDEKAMNNVCPSEINQLKNLSLLKLIYNNDDKVVKITKPLNLPSTIKELNFEHIAVDLSNLPTLNQLETLSFTYSKSEDSKSPNNEGPKSLSFSNTLTELRIQTSNVNIPEIASLTNLETLEINCSGDVLSNENIGLLKNLTSLTYLSISCTEQEESIKPKEIPEFIYSLEFLENIRFIGQGIKSIPEKLCTLRFLSKISLSSNQIEGTIPECLNNHYGLVEVDFSNNPKLKGDALTNTSIKRCNYYDTKVVLNDEMNCKTWINVPESTDDDDDSYFKFRRYSFIVIIVIVIIIACGLCYMVFHCKRNKREEVGKKI